MTPDLTIVLVHPELLGTYGDRGNATVLAARASWRGVRAEVVPVSAGRPLPLGADIYCLGGGEDGPQATSAEALHRGRALTRAVERGAAVLAVCAGYQLVGESFVVAEGERPGLGLLPCRTVRTGEPRAVGEVVAVDPPAPGETLEAARPLGALTGYENHAGRTRRAVDAAPLGAVVAGVGNGDGTEGARLGRIVGTYLHGPVLARNPALADLLLSFVLGSLAPLDDDEELALRAERLRATRPAGARLRSRRARRGLEPRPRRAEPG